MSDVFSHAVLQPLRLRGPLDAHNEHLKVEGWQQCWSVLILLRSRYDASVVIKKVPFLSDIRTASDIPGPHTSLP